MSKTTRTEHCLNQYTLAIQKAYGINDATKQFSLSEPMEIKLRQKILESDAFLKELSLLDVDQIQGQVIDVGTGTLMTGRGDNARFRAYRVKTGSSMSWSKPIPAGPSPGPSWRYGATAALKASSSS